MTTKTDAETAKPPGDAAPPAARRSHVPGAGNEPKEPIKAKERADKGEDGYVERLGIERHLDTATIGRHDDGDLSTILSVEHARWGLPGAGPERRAAVRCAQSSRLDQSVNALRDVGGTHAGMPLDAVRSRSTSQSPDDEARRARSMGSRAGSVDGRPRR